MVLLGSIVSCPIIFVYLPDRQTPLPMAWRFRKSVKLFPGVRLNISKRGVSTTVGVRGASVNFSKRGTYLNTGIPGTGLYNRQKISDTHEVDAQVPTVHVPRVRKYKHRLWPWWIGGTVIGALLNLRPQIVAVYWLLLLLVWMVRPIVHHYAQKKLADVPAQPAAFPQAVE